MSTADSLPGSDAGLEMNEAVVPFSRRAPRISQLDVYRAADELLVEGHRPTIDRVRMKLGRGSPNTINDHLDTWWEKLGSRLRDLPGREFPQLPDRVAHTLQQLWNEALEGAHEALQGVLTEREAAIAQREQHLAADQEAVQQAAHANAARMVALNDALQLMRHQLEEANQRARAIEEALMSRDGTLVQLRGDLDRVNNDSAQLLAQQDRERASASAERERLERRHEATEQRWLAEVDRARQATKAAEGRSRELLLRLEALQTERDVARGEVQHLRGKLATATAVREQLEARIQRGTAVRNPPEKRRSTGKTGTRSKAPERKG